MAMRSTPGTAMALMNKASQEQQTRARKLAKPARSFDYLDCALIAES
jgi:hypothetical protein